MKASLRTADWGPSIFHNLKRKPRERVYAGQSNSKNGIQKVNQYWSILRRRV